MHTRMSDIQGRFRDEDARVSLRLKGQMRYCLFDFDLSRIFPLDAPISDCRLPVTGVKGRGTPWQHPKDVDSVNPDLDPFKSDVAYMGNMLSRYNVCYLLIMFHPQILMYGDNT
jgi:hypothetical protein